LCHCLASLGSFSVTRASPNAQSHVTTFFSPPIFHHQTSLFLFFPSTKRPLYHLHYPLANCHILSSSHCSSRTSTLGLSVPPLSIPAQALNPSSPFHRGLLREAQCGAVASPFLVFSSLQLVLRHSPCPTTKVSCPRREHPVLFSPSAWMILCSPVSIPSNPASNGNGVV
jgi:hypothetical protein